MSFAKLWIVSVFKRERHHDKLGHQTNVPSRNRKIRHVANLCFKHWFLLVSQDSMFNKDHVKEKEMNLVPKTSAAILWRINSPKIHDSRQHKIEMSFVTLRPCLWSFYYPISSLSPTVDSWSRPCWRNKSDIKRHMAKDTKDMSKQHKDTKRSGQDERTCSWCISYMRFSRPSHIFHRPLIHNVNIPISTRRKMEINYIMKENSCRMNERYEKEQEKTVGEQERYQKVMWKWAFLGSFPFFSWSLWGSSFLTSNIDFLDSMCEELWNEWKWGT